MKVLAEGEMQMCMFTNLLRVLCMQLIGMQAAIKGQVSLDSSKSSNHYQSDTNRFDVSSKDPSSGISVGLRESMHVFIQVNILKQHVTK